jgi:hypothetical protein
MTANAQTPGKTMPDLKPTTMCRYRLLATLLALWLIAATTATAHRSGCHRWHSCPSDRGSYVCGDTGHCNYCPDNRYCRNGKPRTGNSDTGDKDQSRDRRDTRRH